MTAQHSSDTPEHGTCSEFVELAHAAMGGIDIDPASSPEWNKLVRATRVITEHENGLRTPWFYGAPAPLELRTENRRPRAPRDYRSNAPHEGRVFCNPPGERTGALVAAFWCALSFYFDYGYATAAVWVGFNVEQLARLQRVGATSHPLEHVTVIPAKRRGYRPSPRSLAVNEQPPHASFVTLLSRSPRQIETFATLAGRLGHVINGDRR